MSTGALSPEAPSSHYSGPAVAVALRVPQASDVPLGRCWAVAHLLWHPREARVNAMARPPWGKAGPGQPGRNGADRAPQGYSWPAPFAYPCVPSLGSVLCFALGLVATSALAQTAVLDTDTRAQGRPSDYVFGLHHDAL